MLNSKVTDAVYGCDEGVEGRGGEVAGVPEGGAVEGVVASVVVLLLAEVDCKEGKVVSVEFEETGVGRGQERTY